MRRLLGLLALACLAVACSAPPPAFSADEFRGMTLAGVYARLNPTDPTRVIP